MAEFVTPPTPLDPAIHVQVTEVAVCALPLDHPDADLFALTVARASGGRWVVRVRGRYLGVDGTWSMPTFPDEAWRSAHLHDYDEAIARAVRAAPDVRCNGHRAGDVAAELAKEASR